MRAIAPGKVILSGEHAVVYGAPALAVAASHHIRAQFTPDSGDSLQLSGDLLDHRFLLSELPELHRCLNQRFDGFLAGQLHVDALLNSPDQLLAYVLAEHGASGAGTLRTESDLPTGAGMGSSAAAIAAVQLLAEQLGQQSLSLEQRFARIRYCERLQHGRGSAIDAAAVTYGGLVRVEGDQVSALDTALGEGWYRVNTGTPVVSTGQCVQQVRERFADSSIWQQFREVTDQLQAGLSDPDSVHRALRENHRLLQAIEVVPTRVAEFIASLEQTGVSAKISGAGAVRGEQGGQVLVYSPERDPSVLCAAFHYPIYPLKEDPKGARLVTD